MVQRLVAVFETIAYAHDRGVLHRDLKPSNIMLGPYGETLVMDWGLAKRSPACEGDDTDEGASPSPDSSAERLTATGAVLGTPRYISPEHAAGGQTGPPSDIFSLGVVLRASLAGEAHDAAAESEVSGALVSSRGRSFRPPRRRDLGGTATLEAVCVKAMAADSRERYESARALAEDLSRWLAAEPMTAYREPIMARLRRWLRRHPRLVAGVTAASIMAAVALVALTVVVSASNRRLERTNKAVILARAETESQRDQAKQVTAYFVSSFRKPDPAQDGKTVTVAEMLAHGIKEDDWTAARARSLQGEALAGRGSFARAEALLLAGLKGLVQRRERIPLLDREETIRDASGRRIRLYEASGKPAEAEKWKEIAATAQPSSRGL